MLAADLIVYNANLITLDKRSSRVSALAVRDGKLVHVGSDREVLALAAASTERIDLGGKTVVPGFCDAHLHLAAFGANLLTQANLVGVTDVATLLGRLAAHRDGVDRPWIEGRGFDQEAMAGRRWPTRADLDRVSTTRPIIVTRVCGHAIVVNSAALRLVGSSDAASGDPESGLYTEAAIAPFRSLVPPLSETEMEAAILNACAIALRTGITSVGTLLDEGVDGRQMAGYRHLNLRGALPIRVTAMPPESRVASLSSNGLATGFGDDFLRIGGAKFFSDGSLGARTALLSTPYADDERADNLGIRIYEEQTLKERTRLAHESGFQIVIHAIGDQAIRESVDAIEFALDGASNIERRHRIEHASLLSPHLLRRMAELQIVAVVQPQFILSDGWIGDRVGPEREKWAYSFREMLDAGVALALSSDCPIESLDAFACLSAVVNRAPWSPDGGLAPEEALRAYCLGGAYSLHTEDRLGSLEVDKLADFVVLSDDPTRIAPDRISSLTAEQVYVAGRAVK